MPYARLGVVPRSWHVHLTCYSERFYGPTIVFNVHVMSINSISKAVAGCLAIATPPCLANDAIKRVAILATVATATACCNAQRSVATTNDQEGGECFLEGEAERRTRPLLLVARNWMYFGLNSHQWSIRSSSWLERKRSCSLVAKLIAFLGLMPNVRFNIGRISKGGLNPARFDHVSA